MTTTTIILWIFFEVYRVLTTNPQIDISSEILKPISPELDTKVLAQIEQRVYFERGETVGFSLQEASPEAELETEPEATQSAEVEISPVSPVATEGAELEP